MARLGALAAFAGLIAIALPAGSQAQDASELLVRLNRLEGQVRQMSGQIEQLQFDNRQLKEGARKFQEDVEFRFQERGGSRPGGAAAAPSTSTPQAPAARPARRSDAFDPDDNPTAAGAPRPLGQSAPSGPLAAEPPARRGAAADSAFSEGGEPSRTASAPLDLNAAARGAAPPRTTPSLPPGAAAVSGLNPSAVSGMNPGAPGAAAPPSGAKAEYDAAYGFVSARQYDQAEGALRRFIAAHPRDRLAADATYWLGESFLQQNKHREAAEQFLRVSTEYTKSGKAPDAFLKLGMSLSAIGAKDQACVTFAELERKYPNAAASVKQGVAREQKRSRCS